MLKTKNHPIFYFLALLILLSSNTAKATLLLKNENNPAQIFQIKPKFNNDELVIEISADERTAIYKDKIKIQDGVSQESLLDQIELPPEDSQISSEEDNHLVPVYTSPKIIRINKNLLNEQLVIEIQGCDINQGFCYLPTSKNIFWDNNKNTAIIESNSGKQNFHKPLPETIPITKDIWYTEHNFLKIFLFLIIGITIAFTPCSFPLLPILLNTVASNSKRKLPRACAYVLGMGGAYSLIGLSFSFLSSNIQYYLQQAWCIYLFSSILALLAFITIGYIKIPMKSLIGNKIHTRQNSPNLLSAFAMGLISVLIVSPCTTPALASILLTTSQGNVSPIYTSIWLFAFGVGSGIPLLAIAIFGTKILPKSGMWLNTTKHIIGLGILAIAVWLITRINDHTIALALWGIYCIICFCVMHITPQQYKRPIAFIIKIVLLCSGVMLMVSASTTGNKITLNNIERFHSVNNSDDLARHLSIAKKNNQYVLMKAHAKWCLSCNELDKSFFQNIEKQQLIDEKNIYFIKLDVTEATQFHKYIEQHWKIIGLPEIIILNQNGVEIDRLRAPTTDELEESLRKI
ncbi:MAG: hypothetical protein HOL58_01550 [Francisellaceae bacterium]|nr:hypothetical protein [Francisellaceae bacterium]